MSRVPRMAMRIFVLRGRAPGYFGFTEDTGTRRNRIRSIGVAPTERFCPMEKPTKPRALDKHDGDEAHEALSFDPATLPAAVDVPAVARRTGEIIAQAARALLGRKVER